MEDRRRWGFSDYGPTGCPLGRKIYPFRRGMAGLSYAGANQVT
jgi:hypothetical protein